MVLDYLYSKENSYSKRICHLHPSFWINHNRGKSKIPTVLLLGNLMQNACCTLEISFRVKEKRYF